MTTTTTSAASAPSLSASSIATKKTSLPVDKKISLFIQELLKRAPSRQDVTTSIIARLPSRATVATGAKWAAGTAFAAWSFYALLAYCFVLYKGWIERVYSAAQDSWENVKKEAHLNQLIQTPLFTMEQLYLEAVQEIEDMKIKGEESAEFITLHNQQKAEFEHLLKAEKKKFLDNLPTMKEGSTLPPILANKELVSDLPENLLQSPDMLKKLIQIAPTAELKEEFVASFLTQIQSAIQSHSIHSNELASLLCSLHEQCPNQLAGILKTTWMSNCKLADFTATLLPSVPRTESNDSLDTAESKHIAIPDPNYIGADFLVQLIKQETRMDQESKQNMIHSLTYFISKTLDASKDWAKTLLTTLETITPRPEILSAVFQQLTICHPFSPKTIELYQASQEACSIALKTALGTSKKQFEEILAFAAQHHPTHPLFTNQLTLETFITDNIIDKKTQMIDKKKQPLLLSMLKHINAPLKGEITLFPYLERFLGRDVYDYADSTRVKKPNLLRFF